MGLIVETAPAVEPVTVAEAKSNLRIGHSEDDARIARLIKAARAECEHLTCRAVAEQTLRVTLDAFPSGAIQLYRPPIVGVDWLKYDDPDGVEQTVASQNYTLDLGQNVPWLVPASGFDWPSTLEGGANAVRVQYVAGWTAGTYPEGIIEWILERVRQLYRDGDDAAPPFVDRLLDQWQVYE